MARGLTPTPKGETLGQYLTGWLSRGRAEVRPSSWRGREQNCRLYIVPALGRVPVDKVTPADVERMTTDMIGRGLSPTSAAAARVTLRKALSDAVRLEVVHRNVAAIATPPRRVRPDLRYLIPAQLRRLLEAASDAPYGFVVTVAATTGLRQGELLGLAWTDVDLVSAQLTVRHSMARTADGGYDLAEPKTSRSRRSIHLPRITVEALRRRQAEQDAERIRAGVAWQDTRGLVFTDSLGRALTGSMVSKGFHRLLEAAGLPSIPYHALRHTAATSWLAAGVPLRVVADQLGHSTIAITGDLYAGVVPELRRDAADAMDRLLSGER